MEDMLDLYRSARLDYQTLTHKNHGLGKINHLNFFKLKYAKLWPIISDWLKEPEKQTIRTSILKMHQRQKITRTPKQMKRNGGAYAGTRTRLNAPHTVFIGEKRKIKV
jgi:hypothetical protein